MATAATAAAAAHPVQWQVACNCARLLVTAKRHNLHHIQLAATVHPAAAASHHAGQVSVGHLQVLVAALPRLHVVLRGRGRGGEV